MKIIVVGNGRWGNALSTLLLENKKEFSFWQQGTDIENNSIIINCLPTQVIRKVYSNYGKNLKEFIFVNGAKGIEEETHKLPYEIIKDIFGKDIDYLTLIGPGFAQEIVDKMPTLVNIGFIRDKNSQMIEGLFETDYFRVRLAKGIEGLELASAFKNVYAIACGIAEGLGFGTNTRTKIILLAIEEFYFLTKKLSINISSDMLPGTIGDLILTCSSQESRNFRLGELLVKYGPELAVSKIEETVEGYSNAKSVPFFEEKAKAELKLARFVHNIIVSNNPQLVKDQFLQFVKEI